MSRHEKVSGALKREVSRIIHDELKDPRIGFTTVTRVEMSKDLRFTKIYYSVLGNLEEKKKTAQALDSANSFIRRMLAERLNLKFAPEFVFKEDNSCEYSIRIQEELEKLKQNDEPKKSRRTNKKR
jgi:ribosome-binding factor A